ncbi:MAG TPA: HlyD family efflux transporter periplasmic adaptor subunit, partial [Candidatus Sulfotelmatobacter sp.]|nr:HlyD family efflux transporter periplasmic adaptor subunit [Candidatus Sulfotelmatobacter sp.]
MNIKNIIKKLKKLTRTKKIISAIIIIFLIFLVWNNFNSSKNKTQYQTAQAQKGTLVVSLTEAGQVSVANKVSVVTQASGIVSNIYVKSGDKVNAGDKIADITLDTAGGQRQAQAWSSYLAAQNSLQNANAQSYSLQNALFVANQKFINDKGIANPTDQDKENPVYIEENANWLAAEAAYKNQSNVIAQSQASLNNAWLSYQLTSGTITAPTSGTIGDLVITKGIQVGSSNTTAGSSTNTSNQTIASISTGDSTAVSVSVAEVDVSKIKVGQTATVTFDAIPNKTFTGKVMGINTTGTVSSGVTTYPAVIELDSATNDIFPNMSATASIITKVDDNVLLVPSSAVQTVGAQSTVKVLKNGQVSTVSVQTGDSSDSQTVIISGLNQGDIVVTNTISTTTNQSTGTSPFSGGLRFGGFGGAGAGGGAGVRRTGN